MSATPVLVFDERGARRFCRASTPEEALASLAGSSVSDPVRALVAQAPASAWVSTFTVASIGESFQLAVSVIGDPMGSNALSKRARELLEANACSRAFSGPVMVRVECASSRELVSPASAFASAKAFYESAKRAVSEFECDLQWRYCPRVMKRPA